MSREVHYGDAFLLTVTEGNLNGEMDNNDLGMLTALKHETNFIKSVAGDVEEYGGAELVYVCIPVARVWAIDDNNEDDRDRCEPYPIAIEHADTQIERMARAAAAMGSGK